MSALLDNIVPGHDLAFTLHLERDEESGWFVVNVVELPGCVSQGATIEEARANIANALESYMEVLLETALRSHTTQEQGISVESLVSDGTKLLVRPRFEVRA